jgi:hypothetical protein
VQPSHVKILTAEKRKDSGLTGEKVEWVEREE